MSRIQNYFNLLAERISIDAEIASSSSYKPDIGMNREQLVQKFLVKHLPRRLSVSQGGQVIGYDGSESKQVDIVVSSDLAVRFEENERTFITTEGLAAAITVKSYLDKSALEDCLLNLASIPQADPRVLKFKLLQQDPFNAFIERHPSLYIFSYKGIKFQTCLDYVCEFYQNHKDIPKNRYPLGIVVNKEYFIKYCRFNVSTTTGTNIPAGTFFPMELENHMWGYSLIDILNNISSYTDWLPFININIHQYLNYAFGLPND